MHRNFSVSEGVCIPNTHRHTKRSWTHILKFSLFDSVKLLLYARGFHVRTYNDAYYRCYVLCLHDTNQEGTYKLLTWNDIFAFFFFFFGIRAYFSFLFIHDPRIQYSQWRWPVVRIIRKKKKRKKEKLSWVSVAAAWKNCGWSLAQTFQFWSSICHKKLFVATIPVVADHWPQCSKFRFNYFFQKKRRRHQQIDANETLKKESSIWSNFIGYRWQRKWLH